MLMRRLGHLEDAAEDGRLALDFKLATSPPVAVAWAAAACIDALTGLGRLADADAVAAAAAARNPPGGLDPHGHLPAGPGRAPGRPAALRRSAGRPHRGRRPGWQALGVDNPSIASWRTDAVAVHAACGDASDRGRAGPRAAGRWPGRLARRGRSGSRCGRTPPSSAIRPASTWPKRSLCWKRPRPGTTWPAPCSTWAHTCGGPGTPRTRGPRCAAPWISPSAPARCRWPTVPGRNCSRPGPGPGVPR